MLVMTPVTRTTMSTSVLIRRHCSHTSERRVQLREHNYLHRETVLMYRYGAGAAQTVRPWPDQCPILVSGRGRVCIGASVHVGFHVRSFAAARCYSFVLVESGLVHCRDSSKDRAREQRRYSEPYLLTKVI